MLDDLNLFWCLRYAMEISLSLLACFALAALSNTKLQLHPKHLLICAVAWLCTIVAVILLCLALGMSLAGLYEGVVRLPLHLSKSFIIPYRTEFFSVTFSFAGLFLAIMAVRRLARPNTALSPALLLFIGAVRIVVAVFSLYYVSRAERPSVLAISPEFVWLILFPVQRSGAGALRFPRMFLAFLAIFETMWAYPVSGSQLAFATFLCVLAMIVILSDGIADIAAAMSNAKIAFTWKIAATVSILALAFIDMKNFADANRATYDHSMPLDLPGSHWIHLPSDETPVHELLVNNLKANADVFYAAPGLFSLNFWTQIPPPTAGNVTGWMYILTNKQQQDIVNVLAAHPRACFIFVPKIVDFWMQEKAMPRGPLIDYVSQHFRHAYDVFSSQIWIRKDRKYFDVIKEDGSTHRVYLKPIPETNPAPGSKPAANSAAYHPAPSQAAQPHAAKPAIPAAAPATP
jgi:hypothetical protein